MGHSLLRSARSTMLAVLGAVLLQACGSVPERVAIPAQPADPSAVATSVPVDLGTALGTYKKDLERLGSDLAGPSTPEPGKPELLEWSSALRSVAALTHADLGEIASLNALRVDRTKALLLWLNAEQERIENVPPAEEAAARAKSDDLNKAVFQWTKRDQDSWKRTLGPTLEQGYIAQLVVRRELLSRKYLQDEYAEGGNFLEGFVNSRLGLTRFDEDSKAWYREAGVSAFEVPFRIEPLIGLEGDGLSSGLLASTGLLYHLFPHVGVDGFEARNDESFGSEYLKRVGLRIGAGAGWENGESGDFVLGAGLQIRSFTAWAVYDFEQDTTTLMLGVSDLGFLQDWIPGLGGDN